MAGGHSLRDRQIASIYKILNLNKPNYPFNSFGDDVNSTGPVIRAPSSTASTISLTTPEISSCSSLVNPDGEPIWKVLVFDNTGRDVISCLLQVQDLRNCGVTVHLNINSNRVPIPDVPAIYLVEPTKDNITKIISDLSRELYSPVYINFLYSIPRPLLEDFASQAASSGTADHIEQIYDQYLNFMVSEPDLFSLGLGSDSYTVVNSSNTTDEQLFELIDQIVNGLFSVVVTMGSIPIIRCPKGGAAEIIAAKLDRKLRDHILNSKNNLFSKATPRYPCTNTATGRPVLVIVDRSIDLVPILSHSWTYQSLVNDVFDMRLNRLTMKFADESNKSNDNKASRTYHIDSNDYFWRRNVALPFPQVAEDIDAELNKYKDDAKELTRKTGVSNISDLENSDPHSSAHNLKAAIAQLPELGERKRTIDKHVNIATKLLSEIKSRQLDNYYEMEMNVTKISKVQLLEHITQMERGNNPMDKLRLFIIWYMSTEHSLTRGELLQFIGALKEAGADTSCIPYIKRVREINKMMTMSNANTSTGSVSGTSKPVGTSTSNELFKGITSLSARFMETAGLGSANLDTLLSGVRKFLPSNKDFTLTKIVESIMEPSNGSSWAVSKTEHFLYFDPKSASARGIITASGKLDSETGSISDFPDLGPSTTRASNRGIEASFGQKRQTFKEGIVFVIGGGSIDEYGNLQDWARRGENDGGRLLGGSGISNDITRSDARVKGTDLTYYGRRVVYGSTELMNATEFVNGPLKALGEESLPI